MSMHPIYGPFIPEGFQLFQAAVLLSLVKDESKDYEEQPKSYHQSHLLFTPGVSVLQCIQHFLMPIPFRSETTSAGSVLVIPITA